jgi:SAM-dependent methyltransferase
MTSEVVADMQAYYARRAQEYERVYQKPERQADLRAMEAALPAYFAGHRVLEIACGTGWWTSHGARDAASWLATDLNPETMAVARSKPMPSTVHFATVDAYSLADLGGARFDAVFAGFWWSHVPLARLPGWLDMLHERLPAGARVMMLDNLYVDGSSTPVSRYDADGNGYQLRRLDDGSTHEVLKNFPTREQAFAVLGARARAPQWTTHTHYWVLSYDLS